MGRMIDRVWARSSARQAQSPICVADPRRGRTDGRGAARRGNYAGAGGCRRRGGWRKCRAARGYSADAAGRFPLLPIGHYYSPIPSYDDLERDQQRIFATHKRDLPGIRIDEQRMRDYLDRFAGYCSEFPYTEERDPLLRFYLDNPTYSRGDAIVLYSMLRLLTPQRVIEIGSGLSTWLMIDINERFFRNGIKLVSVDPYPERMQDGLRGDDLKHIEILPHRVQDVDLRMFADLEPNDIVFIDSTHVSKCDSDVNRIFFEILPALKPGVLIHFHDTFWPFEYPRQWLLEIGVAWNEAYQMRAFLQYNHVFEIEFFSDYVANFMRAEAEASIPVFLRGPGASIWLRRTAAD